MDISFFLDITSTFCAKILQCIPKYKSLQTLQQVICRVDRKTASCAFYVSTRQVFGQKLPISLPRRRIIGLLLYSGCQCGKARQGGSPFPRTKKAPAGARRRACLCPRHRDDEQRHTSPGAAGVFEGAAPPVLKCGQWDSYRTIFEDFEAVYLFGVQTIRTL